MLSLSQEIRRINILAKLTFHTSIKYLPTDKVEVEMRTKDIFRY